MFQPGQFWQSVNEPDLGHGRIVELASRRVELYFPLSEETRIYALPAPPLKRTRLSPGRKVITSSGVTTTVSEAVEEGSWYVYLTPEGRFREDELNLPAGSIHATPAPLQAMPDTLDAFLFRKHLLEWHHRIENHPATGFCGPKVDLIPHQLYVAQSVSERRHPRVLLSDEVGLGKTIEAGMVLHRLRQCADAERILVLVPESLVHQWFIELLRKFNLSFSLFYEETEEEKAATSDFTDSPLCLCSIDAVLSNPAWAAGLLEADWDLLIVDEAHHLHWNESQPDPAYVFVERLCAKVASVLLLTATPEQLGRESHFARLRLLDPNRYPCLKTFLEEPEEDPELIQQARALHQKGDHASLARLLDQHGPGRIIFRNTRESVGGFPKRKAHITLLENTSLAAWLATWLRQHPHEKILAIGADEGTAQAFDESLRQHIHIKQCLFTEKMSLLQRDRSAAWFADPEGAQVMISSEIGGEGRNFQFVQHLLLIDIPSNPEKLEQRIGRLDRIGQKGTVHIWVAVEKMSPEQTWVNWYHHGLNAFEESLPGGYEDYEPLLQNLPSSSDDTHFIKKTQQWRRKVAAHIKNNRNLLLTFHSFQPQEASKLIKHILYWDEHPEWDPFLLRLFDRSGIAIEPLEKQLFHLVPQADAAEHIYPFFRLGTTATTSRETALKQENIHFLSIDHPLVHRCIHDRLDSQEGRLSFASAPLSQPALHLLWKIQLIAPKATQATRFFHTLLLEQTVTIQGERIELDLNQCQPIPARHTLSAETQTMEPLIEQAKNALAPTLQDLQRDALEKADQYWTDELQTLVQLKEKNPLVRAEEVELVAELKEKALHAITHASLDLESLLVLLPETRTG